MKKPILVATFSALLMALACVTVNVYFPAAELQQAADKIVEEVHGKQSTSIENKDSSLQSLLRRTFRAVALLEGTAYAQVNIDVTTPTIRALKASIKERFDSLRPLYDKGVLGETNDGLLDLRSSEGLSLKEKADAKKLVNAENSDRENLYLEITKANDLPADTMTQTKEIFAGSWQKNAGKGWWIQKPNGDWVKKDSQ
jgi:uncharacterized protein YdbL (DUF1318 family)